MPAVPATANGMFGEYVKAFKFAQVGQERSTRTPTAARDVADGLHWKTSCITEGKDIRVQIATRGLRLGAMQNQKQCCPKEQGHEGNARPAAEPRATKRLRCY
ncbi:uncharacterized protein LOC144880190 [Branchiostoma floridae x Branchiostoma japonicum]